MILARLIGLLALVILGSVACIELFKFLTSILPLLIVCTVGFAVIYGWGRRRRRF